jgi:hypothetical protein
MSHDFEELDLSDLEPGSDENILEKPVIYNPLNHAYPMFADTNIGVIEIMVQFMVIRGKRNLPIRASGVQIPMIIEDLPVSDSLANYNDDYDFSESSMNEAVVEGALISEMTDDERYYLAPMIVRARQFISGPGVETWKPLSKEEVSGIITGDILHELIIGYATKVYSDPNAPTGLVDLLQHFTDGAHKKHNPDIEWISDLDELNQAKLQIEKAILENN